MKLLFENGAEVDTGDKYGQLVLQMAMKSGHEAVMKYLVENGAEVNVHDKDGRMVLSTARE